MIRAIQSGSARPNALAMRRSTAYCRN